MTCRRSAALGGLVLSWVLLAGALEGASAQTKPEGEMRWALYVTLPALMLINPYPWSAPLEEVRLKKP